MKNVKCKNCGQSISEKASSCPACGHPNKRSNLILRAGILALMGLIGLIWFASRHSSESSQGTSGPIATGEAGYQLSDQEQRLLIALLAQDFLAFAKGGDTMADSMLQWEKPIRVTADQIQRDYERNEVAGDKAYRGRALVVSGRIISVDRSLGENYSISLHGGSNMFSSPRAAMADGFTDYLAGLNKEQEIYLACKGNGMLMGSAILKNCQPIEDWAQQQASAYAKTQGGKISSGNRSQDLMTILCVSVALNPLMDSSSSCFSGRYSEECTSDLESAIKHLSKAQIRRAASKMGIDSTQLAPSLRG